MTLTLEQMTNGLTPEHDLFFPTQPTDPDMRESTSIWLFEENGAFGFPRIGIEGEAWSWDNRLYHANLNLGGGRILHDTGRGAVPSSLGPDGRATVFGAGPLTFRCIEPFRKWLVSFNGTAVDGTLSQQIAKTLNPNKRTAVSFEVELAMVTPAWVHDYSPEKVAKMTAAEVAEVANMGIGWRLEHLFRGQGTLTVDGRSREFKAVGSRIKRQSVRPLNAFRGHCWQSAVFPDGRAFGYITYPPLGDGTEPYNDGYIYQNGKMYPARAIKTPWLRRIVEEGDDVSLELESALGIARISGSTTLSTFRTSSGTPPGGVTHQQNGVRYTELGGINIQQSGARYSWDDQTTYGMIERSSTDQQMAAG